MNGSQIPAYLGKIGTFDLRHERRTTMVWLEWSKTLVDVLGLKGSPIAITYSIDPEPEPSAGRHWVCEILKDVRDGKTICIAKENSACMGGTVQLGLGQRPSGKPERALQKFLVHGEKMFCSITAFHRATATGVQPPLGMADKVVFSPLGDAKTEPDLVLFLCNAEQACRLITLATYFTGVSPKTQLVGSACHMAITYPLVSGEINVSFMDYTARKMKEFDPNELVVSIPYHHVPNLMESIKRSSAGTAEAKIPPEFSGRKDDK